MMKVQSDYMVSQTYGSSLTLQVLFVYQNLLLKGGTNHPTQIPVMTVRGLWVGDEQDGPVRGEVLEEHGGPVRRSVGGKTRKRG